MGETSFRIAKTHRTTRNFLFLLHIFFVEMVLIFPLKPIIPNGGGPPFQMNVDTMISELAKFDLVPEFTPYFLADEDVHERKGNQMTKLGIFKFKDS